MGYWGFAPYVRVTEKREKARKQLEKIKKKDPNITPVIISGTKIAHTWWGRSWNKNLEGYADYSNRIGRGRSYVRHGAVLDLRIDRCEVRALVQGSHSTPYSVVIRIKPIRKSLWDDIKRACLGRFESLPSLMEGCFPKELEEILTTPGKGLFPSPEEIEFKCNCPDWADMCKHVAAVLYGIGARLDRDPLLFFRLRDADVHDLISAAVEDKTRDLLKKAGKRTSRVMDGVDISGLFGIDMEIPVEGTPSPPAPRGKKRAVRVAPKNGPDKGAASKTQDTDMVLRTIARTKKGLTIDAVAEKTGIEKKRIYGILFRLKNLGKVVKTKGIYIKQME